MAAQEEDATISGPSGTRNGRLPASNGHPDDDDDRREREVEAEAEEYAKTRILQSGNYSTFIGHRTRPIAQSLDSRQMR